MSLIYLDYNATTPLAKEVTECMSHVLHTAWGNPSSSYEHGKQAKAVLEQARENVAQMIGAKSSDVIFTSGGTEANNMIIFGILQYFENWQLKQNDEDSCLKPHIITTNVEHDATLLPIQHLQKLGKIDATIIPVSSRGLISAEMVISEIRPSTCLVSIMLANNESGIIMPVELISSAVETVNKKRSLEKLIPIVIHTDAAQAIGKIPVDVTSLNVDYLTIVGHKFYGPRGGCLYARGPVFPLMFGGGQERGLRPGTENVALAAGLGRAAQLVSDNLSNYNAHFTHIRQDLEIKLKEEFGDKVVINFRQENLEVLPNTCSASFLNPKIEGSQLLKSCKCLEASVGAACHSSNKPSAILIASGISEDQARGTLRLSVGRETTEQDIEVAVADLKQSWDILTG